MVKREIIINKTVDFVNSKLAELSTNNPIVLIIRPMLARAINNNIGKLDSVLKLVQDEKGEVDVEGILSETIDNILVAKAKDFPNILGGMKIGEGNIKINIPFINKAIVFDTSDIESFKQTLIQ